MNLEENSCGNHEYQDSNDSAPTAETSEELSAISIEPARKNFICSVSKAC